MIQSRQAARKSMILQKDYWKLTRGFYLSSPRNKCWQLPIRVRKLHSAMVSRLWTNQPQRLAHTQPSQVTDHDLHLLCKATRHRHPAPRTFPATPEVLPAEGPCPEPAEGPFWRFIIKIAPPAPRNIGTEGAIQNAVPPYLWSHSSYDGHTRTAFRPSA